MKVFFFFPLSPLFPWCRRQEEMCLKAGNFKKALSSVPVLEVQTDEYQTKDH